MRNNKIKHSGGVLCSACNAFIYPYKRNLESQFGIPRANSRPKIADKCLKTEDNWQIL